MQKEEPHKPLLISNTQTTEREKAKNSLKFSSSIDLHGVFTSYSVMIEASNTCSLTHSLSLNLRWAFAHRVDISKAFKISQIYTTKTIDVF